MAQDHAILPVVVAGVAYCKSTSSQKSCTDGPVRRVFLYYPLVVCSEFIDEINVSRPDRTIETSEAVTSKRMACRVDRKLLETERRETSVAGELDLKNERARATSPCSRRTRSMTAA